MYISDVFPGRPAAGTREFAEERSYALLEQLNIPFSRVDHDVAATMEDLVPVELALDCAICKNLFLTNRQQTEFYLLLMPGNKPFKTKYLSKQLGTARLSFGSGEQLEKMLGVTSGSASLLALAADPEGRVHLVIDKDTLETEYFACHPCRNSSTLKMSTADVKNTLLPALGHEVHLVELPWELEE